MNKLIPAPSLVIVAAVVGASVSLLMGSVQSSPARAAPHPEAQPALRGVPELEQAALLAPVTDGERVVGFSVSGVRKGSIWHRMGLRDGDEVQDLYEFSSYSTDDQLTHHELVANFTRDGEPLRVEYAMPPTEPDLPLQNLSGTTK